MSSRISGRSCFELPGVKKEDLDISVTDDRITIRASSSEEKGEYHRREIRRGESVRTLALPAEVDGAGATAKFEDGMLRISLPKLAKTERKSIKVDQSAAHPDLGLLLIALRAC